MKAIILSAGQGKRLLPMTADMPKCMLDVGSGTILEWQINTLLGMGVNEIVIVTGYGASKVDRLISETYADNGVRTLYNPHYATSDNLVSCWWASREMDQDFFLLNGDTLFEPAVASTLLTCPSSPITMAINVKDNYDSDDMKVVVDNGRLVHVGKQLPVESVDGESIGFIRFLGEGPDIFKKALAEAVENPSSKGRWYLSVIDKIAGEMPISTCPITGYSWCEVDYPEDLDNARRMIASLSVAKKTEDKGICQS